MSTNNNNISSTGSGSGGNNRSGSSRNPKSNDDSSSNSGSSFLKSPIRASASPFIPQSATATPQFIINPNTGNAFAANILPPSSHSVLHSSSTSNNNNNNNNNNSSSNNSPFYGQSDKNNIGGNNRRSSTSTSGHSSSNLNRMNSALGRLNISTDPSQSRQFGPPGIAISPSAPSFVPTGRQIPPSHSTGPALSLRPTQQPSTSVSNNNMKSIWQSSGAPSYPQNPPLSATGSAPSPAVFFSDQPQSAIESRFNVASTAQNYSSGFPDYGPSSAGISVDSMRSPLSAIGSYGLFSGRHPVPLNIQPDRLHQSSAVQQQQSSSSNVNPRTPTATFIQSPRTPLATMLPANTSTNDLVPKQMDYTFPARPDAGVKGRRIRVRANFFEVLTLPGQTLFHYDIKITPELPPSLNRCVFKELMFKHGDKELQGNVAVYDGRKNIYTPVAIAGLTDEVESELLFDIILLDDSPASSVNSSITIPSISTTVPNDSSNRKFQVRIKKCPLIDMNVLNEFIGSIVPSKNPPVAALQALDVLLRHRPSMLLTSVGRSFFTRNDVRSLGDGAECWMGFHQSVRPAHGKLMINIDVSATAFFEPGPILNFVARHVNRRGPEELVSPLRNREIDRTERVLRGIKVQTNHRGDAKRKYKIHGLTRTTADTTYFRYSKSTHSSNTGSANSVDRFLSPNSPRPDDESKFQRVAGKISPELKSGHSDSGLKPLPTHQRELSETGSQKSEVEPSVEMSVAEYFLKQYNIVLKFPHLPCLKVGNTNRAVYLPMEVCDIVQGQRYLKKLNENQTAQMIRLTCQTPDRRAAKISGSIEELGLQSLSVKQYAPESTNKTPKISDPDDEKYLSQFGVRLNDEMMTIPARVLEPPTIQYHPNSRDPVITPRDGSWNLRDKKVVQPATLVSWAMICFGSPRDMPQHKMDSFLRELIHTCRDTGLNIANTHPPAIYGDPNGNIESIIQSAWQAAGESTQSFPQLIVCVLPNTGVNLYAEIKRVGDTVLGVATQCVQVKHTFQPKKQYCANVCLKINAKLGGVNSFVIKNPNNAVDAGLPWINETPTIIIGADITHPAHGESRTSGSVCALVGSLDRTASRYAATVRLQPARREVISDLTSMVQELLTVFYSENGQTAPQRILFYRDGLSESQFVEVVAAEIPLIRAACENIQPGYKPLITYVVVQKRHHARLFAMNPKDADRSGNIPAGTVVDSHITHPNEFDFYLCSHSGLQGTSRPTHYHVLHDENNLTPDTLHELTYRLCYSYARCTRSVSVVPPAYYADLVAFRTKYHLKSGLSGSSHNNNLTSGLSSARDELSSTHSQHNAHDNASASSGGGNDHDRNNNNYSTSQSALGKKLSKDEEEQTKRLYSRLARVKPELQRVMYFM